MSAQAVGGDLDRQRRRVVTALTQQFVVHRVAPETFRVRSVREDGTVGEWYTVDTRDDRHTCPDKTYDLGPGEQCKHELAVAFHEADREIPAWVTDRSRLAPGLRPRFDQQRGAD